MDSVGLGQSFKESKMVEITDSDIFDANKELAKFANKQVSDQLKFLLDHYEKSLENEKLKAEIDALERRNEELEDELQGIKDDPSVLMEDWSGDLD